jgi:hypothetical protein
MCMHMLTGIGTPRELMQKDACRALRVLVFKRMSARKTLPNKIRQEEYGEMVAFEGGSQLSHWTLSPLGLSDWSEQ